MSNDRAKVLRFHLTRAGRIVLACILVAVAIWPVGIQPQATQAAPPSPTPIATPTPQPTEPGLSVEGTTPPLPDNLPPEVEQARARQAMEAALAKYLRYWGPRYQVAPIEVAVEGEWAHGVAQWQSENKTLSGPIHILAHRQPDGSWQALLPGSDGLYRQWVDAVPASLVPAVEKSQLRTQAAEADTLRRPQATPAVPPATTAPPSQERPNELFGPQPTPVSASIPSSSAISKALIMYVDAGQIHIRDLGTSSDQIIGPEFGDILRFTVVNRGDFYSEDPTAQIIVDPDYTLVHGVRSPDRQRAVYLEAICQQSRCTSQFQLWLADSSRRQRQLLLSSENSPRPGLLFNPIGWSVTRDEIYLDTSDPATEGSFFGLWRLPLDTGSMYVLDVGPGGYNSLPLMSPDEKWLLFTGFNDKAVLQTAHPSGRRPT